MPFPLDKIKRLGEYDGHWWLLLRCRCCQHRRKVDAAFFIQMFGKHRLLAQVVKQLYCAQCRNQRCRCEGKNFEAEIGLPR